MMTRVHPSHVRMEVVATLKETTFIASASRTTGVAGVKVCMYITQCICNSRIMQLAYLLMQCVVLRKCTITNTYSSIV